mgnify:CR=1 FL=1
MQYSQEQMIMLQKAMTSMYEDNMKFLEIYNKDLFEKVSNLSTEIDNKLYQSRYELEFVNNSFNIIDTQSKKYLYDTTLEDYSTSALLETDFSTKGSMSNLMDSVYTTDNTEKLRLLNNDIQTESFHHIMKDINKFKEILGHPSISETKEMRYIPSFIFFGTLLGSHLLPFKEKFNPKSFLIVEPDLEIFRLSLFVTEYKVLTDNTRLFFSVADENAQMIKTMEQFMLYDSFENYTYKYYSTSYHDKSLFNSFTLALQNTTPFSYDHYRQIHYAKESIRSINKFPVLLEKEVKSKMQELPILVLSPGPSLRENFKWLKKNQDKFITIAFGAAVKALCEVGVKPDIITSVDASTLILRQFPKECKKVYENSLALISTDSHRDLFKFFKKENITVFEPNFKIVKEGLKESPSLTVGDNCIHILLTLGFKDIYLLGTDLSIDLDTGNSYDKTHLMSSNKRNLHYLNKNIKKISEEVDVSSNYVSVESNFEDRTLYADQFFLKIIESYKTIIKEHEKKHDFNVYNLSSGSKIANTSPLQPRDVSLPNIKNQKMIKELKKFLIQKSRTHSSQDEKEYIIHEIDFLNKLLMNIKSIKDTDLENFEHFYSLRKEYAQKIVKHKSYSSLTRTLLSNYMKIIDSFINFVFNDKNSNYSDKTLQKIKIEWCLQVSELIKEYRKVLKKFKF